MQEMIELMYLSHNRGFSYVLCELESMERISTTNALGVTCNYVEDVKVGEGINSPLGNNESTKVQTLGAICPCYEHKFPHTQCHVVNYTRARMIMNACMMTTTTMYHVNESV